jgi:hypothetical protein
MRVDGGSERRGCTSEVFYSRRLELWECQASLQSLHMSVGLAVSPRDGAVGASVECKEGGDESKYFCVECLGKLCDHRAHHGP